MAIREDDPRQPYEQAAAILRTKIDEGAIKPGQKLASIRELATDFAISPTTVQRALTLLREQGLIVTSGRGNFARVPGTPRGANKGETLDDVSEMRQQLEHVTSQLDELRNRVERLEAERAGRADRNK